MDSDFFQGPCSCPLLVNRENVDIYTRVTLIQEIQEMAIVGEET